MVFLGFTLESLKLCLSYSGYLLKHLSTFQPLFSSVNYFFLTWLHQVFTVACGHQVFTVACGLFCCRPQDPRCGVWGLVPWPGGKPGPLHWECRVLPAGPSGKTLLCGLHGILHLVWTVKLSFKIWGDFHIDLGLPWWLCYSAGDQGSVPGSGRSFREGSGCPLMYACLENSMDRGACRAMVRGVAENQTRLRDWHIHRFWASFCRFLLCRIPPSLPVTSVAPHSFISDL